VIDEETDEEMTARLLRLGGLRPDAPPDREARVRRAFLDECRAVAHTRKVRRRMMAAAALLPLAAALVLILRIGLTRESPVPVAQIVATVERLEGDAARRKDADHANGANDATSPLRLALGDAVQAGDQIEAGAGGRVGVRLASGASVRFDHASRARLVSPHRIELEAGALYVDSGPDSPGLEIATPFGLVRDIGTQFETRLAGASLRVRVRSGIVEVHRGAEVSSARPGTELTLGSGPVASRPIATYGVEWAWMARVGPPFDIEGRSLATFLEHVCREQGWTLVYDDPRLAREASGIMLHGSTAGLSPSDALAIVLNTSGLTHRLEDGELEVARIARQ
jgi:hypothetical protein